MSEVLGHDCDGRELRAGDRVESVGGGPYCGHRFTVIGPCPVCADAVEIDKPDNDSSSPYKWWSGFCSGFRLINSGRELFDKCAREADKMPSEQRVLESAPWTEPASKVS